MAVEFEKQALDEESSQRQDARELLLHKKPDGRRPKARQMVRLYVRHERCLPLAERRLPLRNVRGGRK